MKYIIFTFFTAVLITFFGFSFKGLNPQQDDAGTVVAPNVKTEAVVEAPVNTTAADKLLNISVPERSVNNTQATEFVEYAKKFIGTPYVYGSVNPAVGFDCSGFINHVSKHFGLDVPRSSSQFTNLGIEVSQGNARPGDLILFTGTNPGDRRVGHMGIITENPGDMLQFIHSSSGKANGVTISDLSDYYKTRFVKIIRILPGAGNREMS